MTQITWDEYATLVGHEVGRRPGVLDAGLAAAGITVDDAGEGAHIRHRRRGEDRDDHIERIVRDYAGPAFWAEVAKAFPKVTTGDFGPMETVAIENAMEQAIGTWLFWNEPSPTFDQLTTLSRMCTSAAMGENGVTYDLTAKLVGEDERGNVGLIPSPSQAGGVDVEPTDLLVVTGSRFEGQEHTGVSLVDRYGNVKANYDVQ